MSGLRRFIARGLSAPARAYYGAKGASADRKRKVITTARAFDNAPNFKNGKPTDAMKFRSAAADIKRKTIAKNKKKNGR